MNEGYLLLVEDDPEVQANNKKVLTRRGHLLKQAYTLAEARVLFTEKTPRAVILDIQLPDGSGLDFLGELRKTANIPVLLLTAMNTSSDILKGLNAGGDRYIAKPYDITLFLVEVETLLRRASVIPDMLWIDPISIKTISNTAYLNDKDMQLSQREFALLALFTQHQSETLSSDYLYEKAWGQPMAGDATAVTVTISKLRNKLEGSGFTITVKRKDGYRLEKE
jgi:DNA-binding response OmpR family regulator